MTRQLRQVVTGNTHSPSRSRLRVRTNTSRSVACICVPLTFSNNINLRTRGLSDSAVLSERLKSNNLAPIPKKSAGSTGKSGASLLGKGSGGKSGFGSSGSKATFGSSSKSSNLGSASKTSAFGSSASKTSNFGSSVSKTSNFGSAISKTSNFETPSKASSFTSTPSKSTFGSTASKTSTFGALAPKDTSSTRGPSFLTGGGKTSSGLTPSTSRKSYETSYNPKTGKSSTSFGIIWLPGRKRNKKKDSAFSAINYERSKNERSPAMYNFMSGDSPDYQLQKKKDEEANLLVPEKVKGPIATAASAGAMAVISEAPSNLPTDPEEKLLSHDKEDSKEAAGDGVNEEKPDTDYLENNDVFTKSPEMKPKSFDKVDSVFISPTSGIKSPPQSSTSNPEEDDCIVKCLYYTLQCCDCSIM